MNNAVRHRIAGLLIAALIFLADQGLKSWLVYGLKLRQQHVIELLPFFDLRWTQNFGVSLGLFTAGSP